MTNELNNLQTFVDLDGVDDGHPVVETYSVSIEVDDTLRQVGLDCRQRCCVLLSKIKTGRRNQPGMYIYTIKEESEKKKKELLQELLLCTKVL